MTEEKKHNMQTKFKLPKAIEELAKAKNNIKAHYNNPELNFTFDGKLVGDIGEAIAVELFGIKLEQGEGIDGYKKDKSVQVKATVTGRGANFRNTEQVADYLLFFSLNFEELEAEIIYNGPEEKIRGLLEAEFAGQKSVSMNKLRKVNIDIQDDQRLRLIKNN